MGKIQGGSPVNGTTYYSYFISDVPSELQVDSSFAFDFTLYGRTSVFVKESDTTIIPTLYNSFGSATYSYVLAVSLLLDSSHSNIAFLGSNSTSAPTSFTGLPNFITFYNNNGDDSVAYIFPSTSFSYIIKWTYNSAYTGNQLLFQKWLLDNAVYTSTTSCYIDTSYTFETSNSATYYIEGNPIDSSYGNKTYYSFEIDDSGFPLKYLNGTSYSTFSTVSVPVSTLNQSASDLLTYARLLGTFSSYTQTATYKRGRLYARVSLGSGWLDPIQTDDELLIRQTYSTYQSGSVLYIDQDEVELTTSSEATLASLTENTTYTLTGVSIGDYPVEEMEVVSDE